MLRAVPPFLPACPDRNTGDEGTGETDSAGSTDGSASTSNESATGQLKPCPPETQQTRCGDECVELWRDRWNCGACDHACPLAEYSIGICEQGECTPTGNSPCTHPQDDVSDCEALCSSVGQHCAGATHTMWFSSDDDATCSYKATGGSITYEAACDDPFEWDRIGAFGEPAIGANCKCTNEES